MAGSSGSQRQGSSRRRLDSKAFARRLRAIMEERGLTAGETARRMREHLGGDTKFTPANISHYRLGRSLPRPRYLDALSAVLGIDKEELLSSAHPYPEREPSSDGPSRDGHEAPPSLNIVDRGGSVWLQINQQLPWPVAIQILNALKGAASRA
jgi:transcriptional regulator with XRE-family HTH domain